MCPHPSPASGLLRVGFFAEITLRVKPALATALFRDGNLSLARAARLADMTLGEFVAHLSRLGIAVVRLDADEAERDMETLESWLASS